MSNQGQGANGGQRSASNATDTIFKRGDLVWAKVRGYSWWPAKIAEVLKERSDKERKYKVDFIGDNTHQTLPQKQVVEFIDNFSRHALTKKKDLLDSIEAARKQLKKDDQVLLDKKMQSISDASKKQMEKGGIADKDGANTMVGASSVGIKNEGAQNDKGQKHNSQFKQSSLNKDGDNTVQVPVAVGGSNFRNRGGSPGEHQTSGRGSHMQNQQQSMTKSQSTSDSSGVTSKNSSVKKPVEVPSTKEASTAGGVNKRLVKASIKEEEKSKKASTQQLDSSESAEVKSEVDEDESDDDESQIICTKSNKNAKTNAMLAKRKKQTGHAPGKQSVEKESFTDRIIDKDTDVSCGGSNGILSNQNQTPGLQASTISTNISPTSQVTRSISNKDQDKSKEPSEQKQLTDLVNLVSQKAIPKVDEDIEMPKVESEISEQEGEDGDEQLNSDEEQTEDKKHGSVKGAEAALKDLELPTRQKRQAHQEAQKFIKEHTSKGGHKDISHDSKQENNQHTSNQGLSNLSSANGPKATPKKTLQVTSKLNQSNKQMDKQAAFKKSQSHGNLNIQTAVMKKTENSKHSATENNSTPHGTHTIGTFQKVQPQTQKQKQLNEAVSDFKQITKRIKCLIKNQQQLEEEVRQKYEIGEIQLHLIKNETTVMLKLKEVLAVVNERLMFLYKTDICMELLVESGIAKTLKYLQDYSKLYESDLPELKGITLKCDQILQKWKNYVMTTVFDEKKDYQSEFMKYRYIKQAEKKITKKSGGGSVKNRGGSGSKSNLLGEMTNGTPTASGQSMLYKALLKFEGVPPEDSHPTPRTLSSGEDHKLYHAADSNEGSIEPSKNLSSPPQLLKKQSSFHKPSLTLNRQVSNHQHEQSLEYFNSLSKQIEQQQIAELIRTGGLDQPMLRHSGGSDGPIQSLIERISNASPQANQQQQQHQINSNLLLLKALDYKMQNMAKEKMMQQLLATIAAASASNLPPQQIEDNKNNATAETTDMVLQ